MNTVELAPGAPAHLGAFEERFVTSIDGLKLYVRDYPALQPETGAPVIMLHGLTRNSRDFEIVAPRIASLGRRVLVPDMRGRGKSDYDPDPAHYVPAVYAQDVDKIMQALGLSRAVFVGTSMGGIITMVLAALHGEAVAAAALNDVGPELNPAGLQRIVGYVGHAQPASNWAHAAEAIRSLNGASYPGHIDDARFWLAFAHRTYDLRQDGLMHASYDPNIALVFTDPESSPAVDMTPLFEALKQTPVLSIRGALSDILSPAGVSRMRQLKPNLITVEVPGVGHAPMLDEDEAWLALVDFLAVSP